MGERLRLSFRGKGGADQDVLVDDRRLARIVRRCQDVFTAWREGHLHKVVREDLTRAPHRAEVLALAFLKAQSHAARAAATTRKSSKKVS